MRLDHLLSKEQSEAETRRIHPMVDTMRIARDSIVHKPATGRIKQSDRVARQAEFPRGRSVDAQRRIGSCLRLRFSLYRFQGSGNCTLTTAQEVIQYEGQLQYGVMARQSERKVNQYYFKVTTIGLRIKRRKNQANKSTGWMPWHHTPMKDVASCDKLRGAASRQRSVDF